jgi:hypothetical protein
MALANVFNRIGQLGIGLAVAGGVVQSALYNVDGGYRAVMFDRFRGILPDVTGKKSDVIVFDQVHKYRYSQIIIESYLREMIGQWDILRCLLIGPASVSQIFFGCLIFNCYNISIAFVKRKAQR